MILQPLTTEQLNFLKFSSIVLDDFPKALRQTFSHMWDNTFAHLPGYQAWDDSIAVRNMFFAAEGGKTKVPTDLLIKDWDCTALFQATIYARSFALPDSKGHHKTLNELYVKPKKIPYGTFHPCVISPGGNTAESYALAIDQLRLLKNTLCQSLLSQIDKKTFGHFVQLVKDAFTALGVNTSSIDAIGSLKESDFSAVKVRRLKERIKKEILKTITFLEQDVRDKLQGMRSETARINRERQQELKEVGELKDELCAARSTISRSQQNSQNELREATTKTETTVMKTASEVMDKVREVQANIAESTKVQMETNDAVAKHLNKSISALNENLTEMKKQLDKLTAKVDKAKDDLFTEPKNNIPGGAAETQMSNQDQEDAVPIMARMNNTVNILKEARYSDIWPVIAKVRDDILQPIKTILSFEISNMQLLQKYGDHLCEIGAPAQLTMLLRRLMDTGIETEDGWMGIKVVHCTLWSYSAASLKMASALGQCGVLKMMLNDLDICGTKKSKNEKNCFLVSSAVNILHNCAKASENRQILSNLRAVERIAPFSKAEDMEVAVSAIVTLSYITSDEQKDLLEADSKVIRYLLGMLRNCLNQSDLICKSGEGCWSAMEITVGLDNLAVNEKNRETMIDREAISLLVSLITKGGDTEKECAANALLVLVKDSKGKAKFKETPKAMEELSRLSTSGNHSVQEAAKRVLIAMKETPITRAPPEIFARGPLAIEAYNKAVAEGRTRVKRVPVLLIGQDRSGKTSIKKSLMGKPFDPQEGSTVGVEVDPSYFEVTTEMWKTKQEDEGASSDPAFSYEHHVARLAFGSLKKEGTTPKDRSVGLLTVPIDETVSFAQGHELDVGFSNESSARENHSEATEATRHLEGTEGNLDLPADVVPLLSSQDDLPVDIGSYQSARSQEDNLSLIVPEVPEDVATLITKFLKDGDSVEDEEEIYSVLWDFGGQSVYYATHPLFLTPRGIYLLLCDLSRNLHDRAVLTAKQGVYEELYDTYCGKTNKDHLNFWMSSVASLASQDEVSPDNLEYENLPKKLPPVLLVCTHADKPYGDTDSTKQARKVFGSLQAKPYSNHLIKDVFALDNTKSGSGEECPEVTRLRKKIHAAATELLQMKKDIPLKWLKYEKTLRVLSEKGHKWIPLNQARQVAFEVCKIVGDEEFYTLLNFLHDQRILMHFSGTPTLNKMVILDLQWLIDVFKRVITVKPFDPTEKQFTELWDKLEKTGILESKLLEHVWGPLFEQQETAEGLIEIMEKFSLLCPWPFSKGSQQYLVPSMLMSHPTDGALELLASARVASLFIKFHSGQVPQGLFPRLVLQFFQWCTKEWSSQSPPQLFHNFARFYTRPDEGRSVVLLCHSTTIEIVVHSGSPVGYYNDDLAEHFQSKMSLNEFKHDPLDVICCRDVGKQLGLVLNRMREEFGWLKHMKFEMCVCCTVCCHRGSVKYCHTHHKEGCMQEECLHFLSESELRNCQQSTICLNSAFAGDNKVQIQQFAPWFPFLDEQKERDVKLATAGFEDMTFLKSDSLPEEVLSLLAQDVCLSWKALGKQLCITDADLQRIEADNQELYERCYTMLKRWTQVQASPPTFEDLARALRSKPVERGDLAVKYCSVIGAQSGTESREVSSPMDWSYKYGKPTEEEIFSLATKVQEVNWKQLGRGLRLMDSVLCEIEHDHSQLFEKIYAMLMKWKQVKGKDATYRDLAEGLKRVGRNDLIRTFCCA